VTQADLNPTQVWLDLVVHPEHVLVQPSPAQADEIHRSRDLAAARGEDGHGRLRSSQKMPAESARAGDDREPAASLAVIR
jgi:hypothetical protein